MSSFIISVDQSTTATKTYVFDEHADIVSSFSVFHKQIYPNTGWVEHDLNEIYENTKSSIAAALELKKIEHHDIKCISIANQRETTAVWNEQGPIYNAVVWQCPRGSVITEREKVKEREEYIRQSSGLPLSPYFSAAKASWITENIQNTDNAYFGTIDSWLIWKLTKNHLTDYSNASRTQLFNIYSLKWDDELIKIFGLNGLRFPDVVCSDSIFGYTDIDGLLKYKVPVAGILGDSHASLFAQQCWNAGTGKVTLGTGSSIMLNTGYSTIPSSHGLSNSIAWGLSEKIEYVLEGNINCSGDTLNWLKDELGLIDDTRNAGEYALKVSSSGGVYLVPAFVGLGAPHWNSNVRAVICGLSRDSNKYHIIRAAVESIAYQIKDIIIPMQVELGREITELRADGGLSNNGFLMQFTADQLNIKIVKSKSDALSALGAAFAGGLAAGIWSNRDALKPLWQSELTYIPNMAKKESDKAYNGWCKALSMLD